MRAGVWWSALALALLAICSALRPTQAEGTTRISRRPPIHTSTEDSLALEREDVSTPRPRGSRRRDESSQRNTVRSRTRTRPPQIEEVTESDTKARNKTNERFDSRRSYSRTRNRPEAEEDTPKANVIRSRSRYNRPAPTQSTPTTKAPEVTSPNIDVTKIEVINSTLEEIPKMVFKEDEPVTPTNRRTSSTPNSKNVAPRRRSRVNIRKNEQIDLASSGTTNSISISEKGPTTDKMIDLRNSRKLRYKPRLSETDTNLTGLGITASNEVKQSSQKETSPVQETQPSASGAENVHQSTETNRLKTTTLKVMRIVRRPVQRGKGSFKPSASSVSLPKKRSDEVSEEDNYPEPFKALLQAKNASTQVISPADESLSLKPSQQVSSFAPLQQTTFTSPGRNKYSRLRPKSHVEEDFKNQNKKDDVTTQSTEATKVFSTKQPDYKFRSQYTTRNRTFSSFASTTTAATAAEQRTEKSTYKYNRKFTVSSTEAPKTEAKINSKRVGTSSTLLKRTNMPAYFTRKNKNDSSTLAPTNEETLNVGRALESIAKHKASLPRTSYYTRQRNSNKVVSMSTEEPFRDSNSVSETADRKNVDSVDMPLIFTLLKPSDVENENSVDPVNRSKKPHKMFVIAVTSKESQETSTEQEMTSNTVEETEAKPLEDISSTPKYHASYTVSQPTAVTEEQDGLSALPPIRNIPTRKFGRGRANSKSQNDDISNDSPIRDRGAGKYTESYTKTTEPSTNGINLDTEKSKHRFSSKYRASAHLDKPVYRATVPTVTPSTAWLKFFVTDRLLTKYVEEPNWFEEDYYDVTTPMSRLNTTPPITYESSIDLIEGEEFQLGPDMNAISFTQTRSPAELLKLSESLVKPSHVMNVEASQHSQSVTVSIFDALAEILTSTPRNRLSSTTEVQNQNINTDFIQSLNGVSNNINVNNDVLSSQENSLNVIVNTNVQNTDQTLNVNNPSVSAGVTPAPMSPQSLPTPVPTSPVSARKPFAFKVLYSEPTDKFTTAPERTSNLPSTDNPTMVYNTVSDLLLSNNNVVSSELTSMLSSNINNILRNMDDRTKSKVSADMTKILKSLIPRAIDGLDDNFDSTPNTTPYSLEEIKDTGNVNFDINLNVNSNPVSLDFLQNARFTGNVNITEIVANTDEGVAPSDSARDDDNAGLSQLTSNLPGSNSRTTAANMDGTTTASPTPSFTLATADANLATSFISVDSVVIDSGINNNAAPNNLNVPLPFLTNFQRDDFVASSGNSNNNSSNLQNQPVLFSSVPVTPSQNDDDSNIQDINDVTPLQLWILSKKASVLKMIEDLLRDHNNELANATALTEMFRQSDNSPISERLTEIISTMNSTTKPTDSSDSLLSTTPSLPTPLSAQPSNNSSEDGLTTRVTSSEVVASIGSMTTVSAQLGDISTSTPSTSSNAETATAMSTTEATVELSNRSLNDSTTATTAQEVTTQSIETITPTDISTTTQENLDTTVQNDSETTTEVDIETTTNTNEQADIASTSFNQNNNNNNQSTIPKKDYVIFGILPNNTVIRKNPNDDILETLTEASPYIVYGVLPNNTVIRKFPNGTRVPRVMQRIDILPISPWSLRNPYSPIHNNPAIVRPQSNPIRVSTNVEKSTSNNETDRLTTTDTVNNLQNMISTSALNLKDRSSGVTTVANKPPAEQSTASHVLSLRTTTMLLPSVDEILLNSLSSAAKEEMVRSSMTSSTRQPTILTLDIDPETKQIRTEKPGEGNDSAVFKFISIDEVTTTSQNSNVLKLASSKSPTTTETSQTQGVIEVVTESSTQTPQIPKQVQTDDPTTTVQVTAGTLMDTATESTSMQSVLTTSTTEASTTPLVVTEVNTSTTVAPVTTTTETTTTEATTTTPKPTEVSTEARITFTNTEQQAATIVETIPSSTATTLQTQVTEEETKRYQEDAALLEAILNGAERLPKKLNFDNLDQNTGTSSVNTQTTPAMTTEQSVDDRFLQELLSVAGKNPHTLTIPNIGGNFKVTGVQTTTVRSIEDDIRQFEEDTKLLKALLQATGQDPAKFNIPTLDIKTTTILPTTETITTTRSTETTKPQTTTPSIDADTTRFQEDAKLLQALLQATGQKNGNFNIPIISGITSNVRIASNPLTTSLGSNPTTPINIRPIYTTLRTTTMPPSTVTVPTTFQPRVTDSTTVRISTTFPPFNRRKPTTTLSTNPPTGATGRRVPVSRFTVTTEIPTSSTFSVEEDLAFLNNLKSVLNTNTNTADPEAALANRIIALAVDRSLNEIKTGKGTERTGKNIAPTTVPTTTTPTTSTTTTPRPTTAPPSTPSIEDDIRQFQEDTKLLQALLKATGQDPSKFNLPALPDINSNVSPKLPPGVHNDLNLLSNLLASPSPLNEPFDSLTQKPKETAKTNIPTTPKPYGAKIVVKDDVKNVQDDGKLLQTLIQLQGVQETTTQKSKIAITGQSTDEALKKLIQQTQSTGMVQEATKMPIAISTEYGKSNDALLAALLKEQGFGPTTASSLDEQLRLAALLNQVVVTPKARRTTTPPPPPPPPAPRRPILDGLAWLWQQWRETGPETGAKRPNRRPEPSPTASVSASQATSNRVNWFGSGPFVGNADDRPSSNRIPLEPPRAVTTEQTPGRGQLVSAAINVTRAFSQFLGAAIQGAAQTVQNVIRAGQRAATDVYSNGSGASG